MERELRGLSLSIERPVVGFGVCLGSQRIAEMVARTSFDYVMVDLLHSHYGVEGATAAIRSLALSGGPVPLGRVANNDPGEINTLLDAGAAGIIVPMVSSRGESERAVEAAYYPPIGKRSKGSPAAVFYGDSYYGAINGTLSLIVMIETPEAAERADEILSVPHVSGCLVGAGDLSFIMKESGREAEFDGVVDAVIAAGRKHGVSVGLSVGAPEALARWWERGADFFLVSHDMGILNAGLRSHEKKFARVPVKERG